MRRDRPSGSGRHGLLSRVLERRRLDEDPGEPQSGQPTRPDMSAADDRIAELSRRIDNLEALVEGLQDAVHRDSQRRGQQIRELEARTDPAEMSRSLAKHSRQHGL